MGYSNTVAQKQTTETGNIFSGANAQRKMAAVPVLQKVENEEEMQLKSNVTLKQNSLSQLNAPNPIQMVSYWSTDQGKKRKSKMRVKPNVCKAVASADALCTAHVGANAVTTDMAGIDNKGVGTWKFDHSAFTSEKGVNVNVFVTHTSDTDFDKTANAAVLWKDRDAPEYLNSLTHYHQATLTAGEIQGAFTDGGAATAYRKVKKPVPIYTELIGGGCHYIEDATSVGETDFVTT